VPVTFVRPFGRCRHRSIGIGIGIAIYRRIREKHEFIVAEWKSAAGLTPRGECKKVHSRFIGFHLEKKRKELEWKKKKENGASVFREPLVLME